MRVFENIVILFGVFLVLLLFVLGIVYGVEWKGIIHRETSFSSTDLYPKNGLYEKVYCNCIWMIKKESEFILIRQCSMCVEGEGGDSNE